MAAGIGSMEVVCWCGIGGIEEIGLGERKLWRGDRMLGLDRVYMEECKEANRMQVEFEWELGVRQGI